MEKYRDIIRRMDSIEARQSKLEKENKELKQRLTVGTKKVVAKKAKTK